MGRTRLFGRQGMRMQSALSGLGATAVVYPAAFLTALGEGILNLGIIFLMRETYAATRAQRRRMLLASFSSVVMYSPSCLRMCRSCP